MRYTVEIQASNEDGTIWQAVHPAETVEADSAEDAASETALNQNVVEGAGWRVLAWEGEDADTGVEPAATYSSES